MADLVPLLLSHESPPQSEPSPPCPSDSSDAPLSPDDIPLWPYVFAKTLICLYCMICLLSLVSILRIVCNHHKLSSFRFFFLSLTLLWTLLRISFFLSSPSSSAPCSHSSTLSDSSRPPSPLYHFLIDLLYYLPASCQLAMFSLLLLFYAKLYHQHAHTWKQVERRCTLLFTALNAAMLLLTLAFIIVIQQPSQSASLEWYHQGYFILSALFFLMLFLIACNYLTLLYRHTHISLLLSSHHLSLSSVIFLLLLSRCVFDAGAALDSSAILFRRQLFETNAGVLIELPTFLLLVLWEIIPTFLVIVFFSDTPTSMPSLSSPLSLSSLCPEWCLSCFSYICPSMFSSYTPFSSFRPSGQSFPSSESGMLGYSGLGEDDDGDDAEAFYYDGVDEEDDEEAKRRREQEEMERREEEERYKNLSVFSPFSSSLLLSMSSSPSHPFYTQSAYNQYMSMGGAREGKGGGEGEAERVETARTGNGFDHH